MNLQARTARSVSLSGPDGSGKTTLLREVRTQLAPTPWRVFGLHGYGCAICRRLNRPTSRASRGATQPAGSDLLRRWHGALDAGELALRLTLLRGWCVLVPCPTLVVADRGPVDGLVKTGPRAGSLLDRWFDRIGCGFDLIVVLDAPPEVLALRDREHSIAELDELRGRYRAAARGLSARGWPILTMDACGTPDHLAGAVVDALRDREGRGIERRS